MGIGSTMSLSMASLASFAVRKISPSHSFSDQCSTCLPLHSSALAPASLTSGRSCLQPCRDGRAHGVTLSKKDALGFTLFHNLLSATTPTQAASKSPTV